jgi:hypothetical protein
MYSSILAKLPHLRLHNQSRYLIPGSPRAKIPHCCLYKEALPPSHNCSPADFWHSFTHITGKSLVTAHSIISFFPQYFGFTIITTLTYNITTYLHITKPILATVHLFFDESVKLCFFEWVDKQAMKWEKEWEGMRKIRWNKGKEQKGAEGSEDRILIKNRFYYWNYKGITKTKNKQELEWKT